MSNSKTLSLAFTYTALHSPCMVQTLHGLSYPILPHLYVPYLSCMPHLSLSCHNCLCLASAVSVLPQLHMSGLTHMCLASAVCVLPHPYVSCLSCMCLASPIYFLSQLHVSGLTHMCLALAVS